MGACHVTSPLHSASATWHRRSLQPPRPAEPVAGPRGSRSGRRRPRAAPPELLRRLDPPPPPGSSPAARLRRRSPPPPWRPRLACLSFPDPAGELRRRRAGALPRRRPPRRQIRGWDEIHPSRNQTRFPVPLRAIQGPPHPTSPRGGGSGRPTAQYSLCGSTWQRRLNAAPAAQHSSKTEASSRWRLRNCSGNAFETAQATTGTA
nr:proline-rich protein HaeIII subfamily 1-like [Aegilops tauschii subsp. strangulata]